MASGTFGFKGFMKRALELPAGVTSALSVNVSPTGRARLRYNNVAKQLEQSVDGGAYTPLGGTGAGPWDQVSTNVFPDSTGWNVIIGGSSPLGSEKLRVIGNTLLQGDLDFEAGASRQVLVLQAADDTNGDSLSLDAGQGGNYSTGPVGTGGQIIASGGAGGSDASVGGTGGVGGTGNFRGGLGGTATDAAGTGGAGGLVIVEGGDGGVGGGATGAGGGATVRGGEGSGGGTALVQGGPGAVSGDSGGNVFVEGGAAGAGGIDGSVFIGASNTREVNIAAAGGLVGFFGVAAAIQQTITGALSSVSDANAQAVLTSIISALTTLGLATDGTT